MITFIKWSKSQDESKDELGEISIPVAYIGIAAPANPYLAGRFSLIDGLEQNFDKFAIAYSSDQLSLKKALVGQGVLKFQGDCDLHLVECYEPVSTIFSIPEGSAPSDEALKAYLENITKTYKAVSEGHYEIARVSQQGHFAQPTVSRPQPATLPEDEKGTSCRLM